MKRDEFQIENRDFLDDTKQIEIRQLSVLKTKRRETNKTTHGKSCTKFFQQSTKLREQ